MLNKAIISIITLSLLLLTPIANAQEEATDSSLTNKIKERLEQTAQEGLDVIKNQIKTNATKPRLQAYIGSITNITDSTLTLKYKSNQLTLTLEEYTNYSKTTKEDLEIEDFIIAMGFTDPANQVLSAHKITYVANPTFNNPRQIISGKIKEVDGNSMLVDGKTLKITTKTNLEIKGIDSPTSEDIQLEDNLFAIVAMSSDGDINTTQEILIIPGKNNTAALTPTNAEATNSGEIEEE